MSNTFINGKGEVFDKSPADSFLCPIFTHSTRAETIEMERTRAPNWNFDVWQLAEKFKFSANAIVEEMKARFITRRRSGRTSSTLNDLVTKRCRFLFGTYLEADVVANASLDLPAAVMRQGEFVREMSKLGWSDANRLAAGSDDHSIARGIVRYRE